MNHFAKKLNYVFPNVKPVSLTGAGELFEAFTELRVKLVDQSCGGKQGAMTFDPSTVGKWLKNQVD